MVEKLNALGKPISWERVLEIAGEASVGRPHVARALLEAGHVSSIPEAFDLYIGREGPAYAEREKMTPTEAVETLHRYGAPAVMAHPSYTKSADTVLPELVEHGLNGMEVYYRDYDEAMVAKLARQAKSARHPAPRRKRLPRPRQPRRTRARQNPPAGPRGERLPGKGIALGIDQGAGIEETPEDALYCARHPDVETYLRCGKCGTPICPRCLVQTPVGARCRECANVSRLPTFNITPEYFARGMIAAGVSGALIGTLWAILINGAGLGLLFAIIIGLGVGWAVSESVSLSTNRKRGLGLQVCAVLGVVMAYLVQENLTPGSIGFHGGLIEHGDLIAAAVGAIFAASRLKGF